MTYELLKTAKIAILGYGAQGRAEALNLKRSSVDFHLGLRPGGKTFELAKRDGFSPLSLEEAVDQADTILMNLPDQTQSEIYLKFIQGKPSIKRLVFAHGFNTNFKLIPVENDMAHILVAPKGAAAGLLEYYGTANALPAILAIRKSNGSEEPTLNEKKWAEEFALALGCHPNGLIWAGFKDETECDLFSEQALLCGGVSELLRKTYEVLVEGGYHPEAAYCETLFELKLIVDLLWKEGITGMRAKISPTARYGDITRGDRLIDADVKRKMKEILAEVQSGKFAKEFLSQNSSAAYLAKQKEQSEHPIEKMGAAVRERLLKR